MLTNSLTSHNHEGSPSLYWDSYTPDAHVLSHRQTYQPPSADKSHQAIFSPDYAPWSHSPIDNDNARRAP